MIYCGWDASKFFVDLIVIQGHSDEGEEGHNLVCASVSSSVYNCLNKLSHRDCYHIITRRGVCKIEVKKYPGVEDMDALCHLLAAMMQIEREYPKQVRVYKIKR